MILDEDPSLFRCDLSSFQLFIEGCELLVALQQLLEEIRIHHGLSIDFFFLHNNI
jgi:hypothetical protein